ASWTTHVVAGGIARAGFIPWISPFTSPNSPRSSMGRPSGVGRDRPTEGLVACYGAGEGAGRSTAGPVVRRGTGARPRAGARPGSGAPPAPAAEEAGGAPHPPPACPPDRENVVACEPGARVHPGD